MIAFIKEQLFEKRLVLSIRIFLFLTITICLCNLTEPTTGFSLFAIVVTLGTGCGAVLSTTRLTLIGFLIAVSIAILGCYVTTIIFGVLDHLVWINEFFLFRLGEHFSLLAIVFILMTISTWCFFRYRGWIITETILLLLLATEITSPHRKLRFDSPQWIADFAWSMNISQLNGLIGVGLIILTGLLGYLTMGSLVDQEIDKSLSQTNTLTLTGKNKSLIPHAFTILSILAIFYVIALQVNASFTKLAADRLANGVGQNSETGESPLSFYSSLGGSNEPVALLRLENDYTSNPLAPLLYLREDALSTITPTKMVISDYDSDVPRTPPLEHYKNKEDPNLVERVPMKHSIYLIAEHKSVFAADYPISISPLLLKDSNRFQAGFVAHSLVPSFPKERFDYFDVGNPSWDDKTRAHYLENHPDPRYADMAKQITKGAFGNISKALAIVNYFNKNAIYTLSPNHNITTDQDPVSPFLFGDMRGYCVHFAHATVYMLRALGIPSRIGTGFLTDLSQSKDGHTLLRVSDRHAWAEVYVTERGWIPFDTSPEQVESHANSDMNVELLEELMRSLDPHEELLPEKAVADEPGYTNDQHLPGKGLWNAGIILITLLCLVYLIKLFLLFGHILPARPRVKLIRAYRSILVRLYDHGFSRRLGETRLQFSSRVNHGLSINTLALTKMFNQMVYSNRDLINERVVVSTLSSDLKELTFLDRRSRIIATINPASVFAFLVRTRW
jgi:hypothetical protein